MTGPKKQVRRFLIPITVIVIILLGLSFSPHFSTWFSDSFLSLTGGSHVQVRWQNQTELVGALPNFQFHLSEDVEPQFIENSFFIEPQVAGTWSWLQNDLVEWQANQAFPIAEMIRFGFGVSNETPSGFKIQSVEWQVYVRETEIAVLKQVGEGKEIYIISVHTPKDEKQLTFTEGQVIDFAVSTSGERIIFSRLNGKSGADLWLVNRDGGVPNLVLDCGISRCISPDWHPNQDLVVFVMENTSSQNNSQRINLATPLVLNLKTGSTTPVFQGPDQIGYDPVWSSRGQWIAVWNGIDSGVSIVHEGSHEIGFFDLQSEDTGCWSPDDRSYYFSKVREEGLPIVSNIYRADILSGLSSLYTTSVLFDLGYNYYYPACNPRGDGLMVAVQIDPKVPQRELWWVFPDGSYETIYGDLTQLVTQYSWSPDGINVLFLSDTLAGLSNGSQVSVWNSPSDTTFQYLSDNVFKAFWLP